MKVIIGVISKILGVDEAVPIINFFHHLSKATNWRLNEMWVLMILVFPFVLFSELIKINEKAHHRGGRRKRY